MENYKEDILSTRVGCLGGSDAKMLAMVSTMGEVPRSAYDRLAVCKGIKEHANFTTRAMAFGDYVETTVYESLKSKDERWQSNPCLVSTRYSRKNVKCIDHVDLMLVDDDKKTVTIGEVKASKFSTPAVREEYKAQLAHHLLLGTEYAKTLGKYKVKVILCHYNTDGVDLDMPFSFDPERLNIVSLKPSLLWYDLAKAMDIVDTFLDTFTEYYDTDDIDASMLPENVRHEFDAITTVLMEIKEREATVDAFKERLVAFMGERGIKNIKNDAWSISYVGASSSTSVDYKAMAEKELLENHPHRASKLRYKYEKTTNKKAYVTIRIAKDKK